ncbi:MAG: xanthine dehydrogenase small subunit, partial [Proteobacteria bacterium]|nr:xanthine dehydrogenase small subunit [Pseudomonadota bacterium]
DRFQQVLDGAGNDEETLNYVWQNQRYLQPTSLAEFWEMRAAHGEAAIVAGGTDLALTVNKQHIHYPVLIGLEGLVELRRIETTPAGWRVGAMVTLTNLLDALGGDIPALGKLLRVFGSRQIRSRATLGGNICNASPIGDTPPLLLALGAEVVMGNADKQRVMPLNEFFLAYRQTALEENEILLAVQIPRREDLFVGAYKVSKRRELDISICSAGMAVHRDGQNRVDEIRLAYGGMAAIPQRASHTEAALLGQAWTEEAVEAALPCLNKDFAPIGDLRGSAAYRVLLAKNLLRGFYLESTASSAFDAIRPVGTVSLRSL